MAEALAEVKRHYGKNALILNTRTINKGGLFGLGAHAQVEITAAPDGLDLPAPIRRASVPIRSKPSTRVGTIAPPGTSTTLHAAPHSQDALLSELGALKSLVTHLVREIKTLPLATAPTALYETYLQLVRNAVAEEIATSLVDDIRCSLPPDELNDAAKVRNRLQQLLEPMLPTAGAIPSRSQQPPTVIALVGPTGVGKTTTVAKLAANLCLRQNQKVGLVTIDTYRIAAVEQLRTYAQIIDVPIDVAMTPRQLEIAVRRMSDRDVILIDTAGRSQRDAVKIAELQSFFETARPHEVHLVLSSTSGERVLCEAVEHFGTLGIDRVIFTKLDEAIGFGVLLTCLKKTKARLSYVTTGQDVPDDIEVGDSARLAAMIMNNGAV